jgi:hypothetical protein
MLQSLQRLEGFVGPDFKHVAKSFGLFDLGEAVPAFLANNLWLLVATILVIFMNAGFAMVEAGMCRQKNAVNILAKNLFVLPWR